MTQEHDKGFKDILSNRIVFASLLKSFISARWTAKIRPEALKMVPTSFITPDFEKREADIIYKLISTSQEVYFYCLMELQSTVDYSMP
ncbi:MAG: Rpn family recombination-promoting nuclease/putative transposase, partial [Treponema sp.]|nr:Rpn family recombination-promoting nuclease/putative transposase [Treponema sp.]